MNREKRAGRKKHDLFLVLRFLRVFARKMFRIGMNEGTLGIVFVGIDPFKKGLIHTVMGRFLAKNGNNLMAGSREARDQVVLANG